MFRLIIWLLFLIASVWFGLNVMRHPGYLFIVYQPWMVQMPLWFALIATVFLLGLFYLLINSVDRFSFMIFRIKNWLRFRKEHKSYSKTQHGLSALIEGRWKKAERLLQHGVNQSIEPLINYLGAARAAQELGAFDRRDNYIRKAYETVPNADLAIGLTQAELFFEHQQIEQALATLTRLRKESPRHPRVLRLLEKVYVRLGDWESLKEMLPSMRKAKMLNAEQLEQFEKNLYCEMLRASSQKNLDELKELWNSMPRYMRKNPDVVHQYVLQLKRFNDYQEIEELIRKTLKSHWQDALVAMYGNLPFTDLNRQLVVVGAWLKTYGSKPETLLTLGKLCMRIQLWGKAKDYFEKCLALGPNPEASLSLAKLMEELGEQEEAKTLYRQGLLNAAVLD